MTSSMIVMIHGGGYDLMRGSSHVIDRQAVGDHGGLASLLSDGYDSRPSSTYAAAQIHDRRWSLGDGLEVLPPLPSPRHP
jgi:hypothetical protein